ncbi:MAG: hypothetical protein WA865_11480 [Spirulinaceae cyanobacterium]
MPFKTSVQIPDQLGELLKQVSETTGESKHSLMVEYIKKGLLGDIERLQSIGALKRPLIQEQQTQE